MCNRLLCALFPVVYLAGLFAASCSDPQQLVDPEGDTETATGNELQVDNPWDYFAFTPSNIDLAGIWPNTIGDVLLTGSDCSQSATIHTDDCQVDCLGTPPPACVLTEQGNGSPVTVLFAHRFLIDENISVKLEGQRPLVIVATEEVEIFGTFVALDNISSGTGLAGGYSASPISGVHDGLGPGGGEGALAGHGSGGGSFCGEGGAGGMLADALYAAGLGGATYGNEQIIPLTGGSAGGSGEYQSGGAGGGALQIASAAVVTVGINGIIAMPGNGGDANVGNGGGSGGAVLLEAPVVRVRGGVFANGGGGGGGDLHADGMPGQSKDRAALGGQTDNGGNGGNGSFQADSTGAIGLDWEGAVGGAGGGGGGAGWIRINTADGAADVTGVISPGIMTGCASIDLVNP